ncbi:unnamed protein product [Chironomus riparius]|uniref:Uncharacterized protein n=1 Tax=Chironomus riparius TaxID=315576 RepID=A0A9N9RPA5_9DIPT|nr:unnamed protein product [Chironomus riparius]
MAEKSKQEFMQRFLNNARKKALNIKAPHSGTSTIKQIETQVIEAKDEDWLTKKALEEIERNAKIHKVKRESGLPSEEPKAKTNKRFLTTTLTNALSHNERKSTKNIEKSSHKLKELERYQKLKTSTEKFGDRKHHYKKPEKSKESDDSSD